jgi:hypothetical protein
MRDPLETDQELERLLHGTLRDLPPRSAPHTLESRVFDAIARRAVRPWWQRSFAGWPRLARGLFVMLAGGLAGLTLAGGPPAVAALRGIGAAGTLPWAWAQHAVSIGTTARTLATVLRDAVPAGWAYGGLAASATLYGLLFGLAAFAVRMFQIIPTTRGRFPS